MASAWSATCRHQRGRQCIANNGVAGFLDSGRCFTAGMPLLTPEGSRPIETLRPGDLALARPDDAGPDGPVEAKPVERTFERVGQVLHLHVLGQVVRTTAEHPFWTENKGWTRAIDLKPGDRLAGHDGQWAEVDEVYDTGCVETVYNLRVADYHTYFVGCREWGFDVWAHNTYELTNRAQQARPVRAKWHAPNRRAIADRCEQSCRPREY